MPIATALRGKISQQAAATPHHPAYGVRIEASSHDGNHPKGKKC